MRDFKANAFDWVMGCTLVYCCMFGIGELVLQAWITGFVLLAVAALAGYFIYWSLSRRGWETLSGASSESLEVSKGEIGLQEAISVPSELDSYRTRAHCCGSRETRTHAKKKGGDFSSPFTFVRLTVLLLAVRRGLLQTSKQEMRRLRSVQPRFRDDVLRR